MSPKGMMTTHASEATTHKQEPHYEGPTQEMLDAKAKVHRQMSYDIKKLITQCKKDMELSRLHPALNYMPGGDTIPDDPNAYVVRYLLRVVDKIRAGYEITPENIEQPS